MTRGPVCRINCDSCGAQLAHTTQEWRVSVVGDVCILSYWCPLCRSVQVRELEEPTVRLLRSARVPFVRVVDPEEQVQ